MDMGQWSENFRAAAPKVKRRLRSQGTGAHPAGLDRRSGASPRPHLPPRRERADHDCGAGAGRRGRGAGLCLPIECRSV